MASASASRSRFEKAGRRFTRQLTTFTPLPSQPSIYPQPEPEVVLVETHSALEQQIATARRAATSKFQDAHARIQGVVDRWIGVEHAVERRVKSLIPADETLTPGALYVGVGTLTGSILARNRSFLLRFTLPPALFILSMNYFLPKTSHNLSCYMSSLERIYTPSLAETHQQVNQRVASTSVAARDIWVNGQRKTVRGVERTVSELQDRTGLKLREALGWGQKVVAKAETSLMDVEKKVDDVRK